MKTIYRWLFIFLFILTLIGVIFYAKGYRFDINKGELTGTGLLSINSVPKNARVYINDKLAGITDINLNLQPDIYKIRVESESPNYNKWEKTIQIKKGFVAALHAHLFLKNPGLKPLSSIGIKKLIQIDDVQQYIILAYDEEKESDALYLLNLETPVLSLDKTLQRIVTTQDLLSTPEADLSTLSFTTSPDFTQLLLRYNDKNFLITLSSKEILTDVDAERLEEKWKQEEKKKTLLALRLFPKDFQKIATSSVEIISLSPDETKLLYKAKKNLEIPREIQPPIPLPKESLDDRVLQKNRLYLYDKKQDHNFQINLPSTNTEYLRNFVKWHPDSLHLFFFEKDEVKIIDYDGEIKRTIYAGPFQKEILSTNKKGNIILLINLNQQNNKYPDLYEIEIN